MVFEQAYGRGFNNLKFSRYIQAFWVKISAFLIQMLFSLGFFFIYYLPFEKGFVHYSYRLEVLFHKDFVLVKKYKNDKR